MDKNDDNAEDRAALAAFYEGRKDEPLWVGPAGFTAKADAVIGEIKRANDWGLDVRDYDLSSLPGAGSAISPATSSPRPRPHSLSPCSIRA